MNFTFTFFLNSILLGVGLAMDAFSVSIANGLNEPHMRKLKGCGIAGTFAFFQFAMPMIGWVCVHEILNYFQKFQRFIPWIALGLLLFIGGKMVIESSIELHQGKTCKKCSNDNCENRRNPFDEKNAENSVSECKNKDVAQEIKKVTFLTLIIQGIATSIDALSVGFTISEYNWVMALICSIIIAIVTFGICVTGLFIGKKVGEKFASKAQIFGGIILIGIGIEIFVKGVFFGG